MNNWTDVLTTIGDKLYKLTDMAWWVFVAGMLLLGASILLVLFVVGLGRTAWELIS